MTKIDDHDCGQPLRKPTPGRIANENEDGVPSPGRALQDKQIASAAIRKLFRKIELPPNQPRQGDSPDASTPKTGEASLRDSSRPSSRTRAVPDRTHPANEQQNEYALPEALGQLQAIISELQLGPTHTLKAFARELERLRPAFAKKRRLLALIDLQAWLCRRLILQPGRTHRQAAIAFFKGFGAIERLATERGLSATDEQMMVNQVVAELKSFNNTLTTAGTDRNGLSAPEKPIRSAHPVEPVERLMEFLKEEINGLENLLRSPSGDRENQAQARNADRRGDSDSAGRNRPKGRGHR